MLKPTQPTKKRNAWAVTKARIVELEQQLQEVYEKDIITPFVCEFLQGMGTVLANTPLDKWPPFAIAILKYYRQRTPTAYDLYIARLPKTV